MYSSDLAAENYQPAYDSYDWSSEDLTPADLREEPEFARYLDRWVKYWPRTPYNVKWAYDGGFVQAKTTKGNPSALSGDWLVSCIERHLDNRRWAEQYAEKRKSQAIADLVAQGHDEESAARWVSHETRAGDFPVIDRPYWLGLWPARMITDHCIDFDAKKYLLAHYRHRGVVGPVVCPVLDHFRALKRLHDHFPDRIWCISSLTLGVHAWARHGLQVRHVVHRRVKRQLEEIGLGAVEVHPMQGRCLRRPFGRDYVTITPEGEVAPWQWQVDYYEDDGRTAPFDRIVEAMIRRVERSVDRYYRADEALGKTASLSQVRPRLDAVRSWRDAGFEDRVLVPAGCSIPALAEEPGGPPEDDGGDLETSGASAPDSNYPEAEGDRPGSAVGGGPARSGGRDPSPSSVPDLRSRKWPCWVEAMARTGLLADDTVGPVVFELAKWLYWVELHHLPAEGRLERVRVLLRRYVLEKHNGYITRMLNGQAGLVLSQVNSAVASASRIDRPESLGLFAGLRQRREQRAYWRNIVIAPILEGTGPDDAVVAPFSSSPLTTLLFSIKDDLLPAELEAILSRIAQDQKMRRRGGVYPIVRFARRFLWVLWDNQGTARLDIDALKELSGVNSPRVQNDYKRLLRDAGLIDDWENDYLKASSAILDGPLARQVVPCRVVDKYKVGVAPILYRLTEMAEESFRLHHQASLHVGAG